MRFILVFEKLSQHRFLVWIDRQLASVIWYVCMCVYSTRVPLAWFLLVPNIPHLSETRNGTLARGTCKASSHSAFQEYPSTKTHNVV